MYFLVCSAMAAQCATKSGLLFDAINASQGFYHMPILEGSRSRVNVSFRICTTNGPDTDMEEKFIRAAENAKIIHIKGHRSVGGLRASLYNAVTLENTKVLIEFMMKFIAENNVEQ